MARGPVWIEAYEQYLLRKNVCEKSELERLSDDALAEKYFQYVREADCEEAAFDWVQKYCRQCSGKPVEGNPFEKGFSLKLPSENFTLFL